jgi:hypothetical protein
VILSLGSINASEPDGARRAAEQLRERGIGAAHVKVASGGCAVAASACAIGADGSQESYPSPEELAAMRARVVQANQPREAATGR